MSVSRAVDVGFGQVKFTTASFDEDSGCRSFPAIATTATTQLTVASGIFTSDDIVNVQVENKLYSVGPDAAHSIGANIVRHVDSDYSKSNEYMALLRGAMYYMKQSKIDSLVVGLPVSTYLLDGAAQSLKELILKGGHVIPNFHNDPRRFPDAPKEVSVQVVSCEVLPQPVGTFFNHCILSGDYEEKSGEMNLIIDIGYGTYDWFVGEGNKAFHSRCGAYNGGMSRVVSAIAEKIDSSLKDEINVLRNIDKALRTGKPVKIHGIPIDLGQYKSIIDDCIDISIRSMLNSVGSLADIENVYVTGGGTFLWKDLLTAKLKRKKPLIIDSDPVFSNVKGFQIAAEQRAEELAAHI